MKSYAIIICCFLMALANAKAQRISADTKTLDSIRIKLEQIYDRDEHYRLVLDSIQGKFHMGTKEYEDVFTKIKYSDSLNQLELIPIIEQYGWLGKSRVGAKANEAIFYVVQHSDLHVRIKYVPQMRASVAKGESNAKHLEWLEDRIAHDEGKPEQHDSQKYAVQRKNGSFDFYEDINDANRERRKEGIDTIPFPSR